MHPDREIFWNNLEHIKDRLVLSDEDFSRLIGTSYSQYSKCKLSRAFLPVNAVYELAEKLNFHFADLLTPGFKLQMKNDEQVIIPEKYLIAPYSRLTPTANIINYLEKTRGSRTRLNLLRKFQLTDEFLQNPDSRANIHLISDVVKYLGDTFNFTDNEFLSMGRQTPYSAAGKLIENELKDRHEPVDLLEGFIVDCAKYFDANATYRLIDVRNDFATMEVIPNKDVLEELKIRQHQFGNEEVCLTKMGCISSFSYFRYRRYARIEKLTSAYDGDATNRYLIDLAPLKKLSSALSADVLQFQPIHH